MTILVQKFGGTSVANPERIQKAARRLVETAAAGHQVVAVVSAMGHTTDELLQLAGRLSTQPSEREIDMLLSTGEQVTCALMALAVAQLGVTSISLTGGQAGIRTETAHSRAKIIAIDPTRIHAELGKGRIVIVAGFQGVTEAGEIATLGRGGSDTTAVALAGAIGAQLCEIYTDVDGVYTADPRIVPNAKRIEEIAYDEMWELAQFGANVLHPRAVESARRHGMAVRVRSSFDYEDRGTLLCRTVTAKPVHKVYGLALDVVLLDTASLDQPGDRVQVSAVVTDPAYLSEVLTCVRERLDSADIPLLQVCTTAIRISCLIPSHHAHQAMVALHTALGLDGAIHIPIEA